MLGWLFRVGMLYEVVLAGFVLVELASFFISNTVCIHSCRVISRLFYFGFHDSLSIALLKRFRREEFGDNLPTFEMTR